MTFSDEELKLTHALCQCRFRIGSIEKKFARSMQGFTGEITERQQWYLYYFIHRYRRQINSFAPEMVMLARAYLLINPNSPEKKGKQQHRLRSEQIMPVVKRREENPNQLRLFP